jgi:hypothetical protein
MNQLSNLNAKLIKEVVYNPSLQPGATTINFTVENCSINAYIEQIIITLNSADANFYSQVNLAITDRGNGYSGSINGFNPFTFTNIGTSSNSSPVYSTSSQIVSQNGNNVIFDVFQSVQDSEGLGNIYIQLSRVTGTFNVGFTMAVVFRPEITYNSKLNTRNQISFNRYVRVLSKAGTGGYSTTATMLDQTNFVGRITNTRNNVDILNYGMKVDTNNPYFYFGVPQQNKRWFLGFSSDNTPNIGFVTFSYYNGSSFVGLLTTQVSNGCLGPGTYQFANDGVIIFSPPTNWSALQMVNDPVTIYNTTMIGLGTLSTNNVIPNPGIYWMQCQVGFVGVNTLYVTNIAPLIDPAQPLTNRRPLI